MGGDMYKKPENAWVDHWSEVVERRGKPIVAEVRYDLKALYGISLPDSKFSAKALLYVRVNKEDLYKEGERKPRPQQPFYVDTADGPVQEWLPWLEIQGTVDKVTWVREDTEHGATCLVFAYEIEGTFPLGANERGHLYPFDYHHLTITITSNWDAEKIVFVPWDSEWTVNQALVALKKDFEIVDDAVSRVRTEEVDSSLKHKWNYSHIPAMQFGSSTGFTNLTYSEVSAIVLVRRVWLSSMLFEMLRPFTLAVIAPTSYYFLEDLGARLGFNVTILVAMSLSFLRNDYNGRITLADWYRLFMFFFAAFVLVLGVFPDVFSWLSTGNAEIVAWAALGFVHGLFLLYLFKEYPTRFRVKKRFTPSKKTSLIECTNSLQAFDTSKIASVHEMA